MVWVSGGQENQAGAASSVQLLQPLVAKGATILISRHGRKSGGSAHDAGRGSSAIDGAVDFIINLTKPSGEAPEYRSSRQWAVSRCPNGSRFDAEPTFNFPIS